MACSSIIALTKSCDNKGVVAGLEKMYAIAYNDLSASTLTQLTYSAATNGVVNAVYLAPTKKFVEVGLLKSTAGLNESLTKNAQNGTSFTNQTLTLVLADLTTENRQWIESIMNQPIAIIAKSRTGKFFIAGLNGQFELSAMEGGTGIAEDSLIGYTLTFTGIDGKLITQVDSTIVGSLLA